MKLLRNMMEKIKPSFEKGGKFEKYFPVYDGFETFLFVPGHETHKGSHIRDGIDMKRTMIMVVLALVPCLLFGMWNTGHWHYTALGQFTDTGEGFWDKILFGAWKVLPIVVVSYGVGLTIEFIFCIIRKHPINEGFLVTGMLIPLVMPVGIPLWMVAVGTAFCVVIGKEVFGGSGMNILNPALTARAFLFFAYPTFMSGDKVWVDKTLETGEALAQANGVDAVSGATLLGDAATTIDKGIKLREAELLGNEADITKYTSEIKGVIDSIPEHLDLAIGIYPGSIGETSAIACLLGAGLLLFVGIASWRVMFSMLLGGLAMGWLFNTFAVNAFMEIDPLSQVLLGGFMFGMVFMATDPVSAAQTNTGKWIYGFFCGFFAIMIRVFNPAYPEGVMLAILFMNVMAPLIDHYVVESNVKRRLKRAKKAIA